MVIISYITMEITKIQLSLAPCGQKPLSKETISPTSALPNAMPLTKPNHFLVSLTRQSQGAVPKTSQPSIPPYTLRLFLTWPIVSFLPRKREPRLVRGERGVTRVSGRRKLDGRSLRRGSRWWGRGLAVRGLDGNARRY